VPFTDLVQAALRERGSVLHITIEEGFFGKVKVAYGIQNGHGKKIACIAINEGESPNIFKHISTP
jgi:hypothetical protein